jgi:hypothetical protein
MRIKEISLSATEFTAYVDLQIKAKNLEYAIQESSGKTLLLLLDTLSGAHAAIESFELSIKIQHGYKTHDLICIRGQNVLLYGAD